MLIALLCPLRDLHLLVAQRLDVVGVGRTASIAFFLRLPGGEFHLAALVGDEARPRPSVVLAFCQPVPAQDGQFARDGHGGNLVPSLRPHADEEAPQRPRRLGRRPGCFDQHRAGMAAPGLTDAAVMRGAETGLANPRVQSEVAHQLLGACEAVDAACRRHEPRGDGQVHAGDRQQAMDGLVFQRVLRDVAVQNGEVFAQPVELADVTLDCSALVFRERLRCQPCAPALVEKVGMRALGDQMCMQDRMHLVLDPRAMTDDLIAPGDQPSKTLGGRVRCPDLRQVAGCMQVRQRACVDLVGLHMSMGDGLHLQWVGDHHPRHEGCEDPRHRHGVAGRLNHHLIRGSELSRETLQRRPGHVDPTLVAGQPVLPDHHLPEGPVYVHSDHASHARLLRLFR